MKTEYLAQLPRLAALELKPERADAYGITRKQPGATARPWSIHNNIGRKGELGILADAAPCIIACMGNSKEWPVEARANAALIVQSVNEREALLAVVIAATAMQGRYTLSPALEAALDKLTKDSVDKTMSTE